MNYLQISQFAQRYIGGGNAKPGLAPTTVVGQQDFLFEVVLSVADAYRSIQNEQDQWHFMQKQGAFVLSSGDRILTRADMIAQIADYDDIRADLYGQGNRFLQMYSTASGPSSNTIVTYVDYQTWRGTVDQNTIPTGKPYLFTVQPDRSVEFNFIADQDYTAVCDYKRLIDTWVQVVSGTVPDPNLQVPIFPERFHEAVAWRAIMLWAGSIEDSGKYQFARDEYKRIMEAMDQDRLPEIVPYQEALYAGSSAMGGW